MVKKIFLLTAVVTHFFVACAMDVESSTSVIYDSKQKTVTAERKEKLGDGWILYTQVIKPLNSKLPYEVSATKSVVEFTVNVKADQNTIQELKKKIANYERKSIG